MLFFFFLAFVLRLLPELFYCSWFSEGNATVFPLLGKIISFFILELTFLEKTEGKLYYSTVLNHVLLLIACGPVK